MSRQVARDGRVERGAGIDRQGEDEPHGDPADVEGDVAQLRLGQLPLVVPRRAGARGGLQVAVAGDRGVAARRGADELEADGDAEALADLVRRGQRDLAGHRQVEAELPLNAAGERQALIQQVLGVRIGAVPGLRVPGAAERELALDVIGIDVRLVTRGKVGILHRRQELLRHVDHVVGGAGAVGIVDESFRDHVLLGRVHRQVGDAGRVHLPHLGVLRRSAGRDGVDQTPVRGRGHHLSGDGLLRLELPGASQARGNRQQQYCFETVSIDLHWVLPLCRGGAMPPWAAAKSPH